MSEKSNSFVGRAGEVWTSAGDGRFKYSLSDSPLSPGPWSDIQESQNDHHTSGSHRGYQGFKEESIYKKSEVPLNILAIGDVHGREVLSRIKPDRYDKIIFLGDYVDSHDDDQFPDARILDNLKAIIAFKKFHPDKVVLLLGNHDVHYIFHGEVEECSGFRRSMLADLQNLFMENSALFQMAYQRGETLFTHAGVSNAWYREYNAAIQSEFLKISMEKPSLQRLVTLADKFNLLLSTVAGRKILFQVSGLRIWPQNLLQSGGIIWADQEETDYDYMKGYHQVVGHTVVSVIEKKMDYYDDQSSITYIDTQNREFLELSL